MAGVEIEVGDEHAGLVAGCSGEDPSVRVAHERRPVELERPLRAHAVHDDHVQPVRDRVPRDDAFPEGLGVELGVAGLRSDGGGVDEHVGTGERVGASHLGEPLVPTRRKPERRVPDRDRWVPVVARQEPAVLVVALGDGKMCLARVCEERAARIDADRSVVPEGGSVGLLVQRRVDRDVGLGGEGHGKRVGRSADQRLRCDRDVEHVVSRPARVDREVRGEGELHEAHDPRACIGGAAYAVGQRSFVFCRVGVPAVLHEPDAQR